MKKSVNGKIAKLKVHRLVAILFYGKIDNMEVNHIDGDKSNNKLYNLEWISHTDNLNHAFKTGLTSKSIKQVKCINSGVIYDSCYRAGKECHLSQGSISNACSGRRKSAGGFKWEWILN